MLGADADRTRLRVGGANGLEVAALLLLTPLVSGAYDIPKSALVVGSLGCSGVPGSAPATAGAGGNLGGTVLLCQTSGTALNAGGSTSGVYEITGGWTLNIPAYQAAGSYIGTLSVTLA